MDGERSQIKHDTVLDVTEEQIARTYAQGFLGALDAAGVDPAAPVGELEELVRDVFGTHPRLMETLTSAFLDADRRLATLDRVFGGRVDPTVLRLMKVLSAHGRIGVLRSVSHQARLLLNERSRLADVLVRLAAPADDATLARIKDVVREKIGVEPILSIEIDPELVGGVEIRVGDTVFDGSIRTAFKNAHKAIVAQTVEAIETQPERFTIAG